MPNIKPLGTFTVLLILLLTFSLAKAESKQVSPLDGMPSGDYSVDLAHASVIWKVSHLGFSKYVGRFNEFTADLNLDTADFTKSRVVVDIKVDSLDTDYPLAHEKDFNKILAEEWFKSADYPSITFKATSVSALVENKAIITGEMTMLGETHDVELDMTLNKSTVKHPFKRVPVIGFSASTTIDRTIWGFTKNTPGIGAEVIIEIEGEFLKVK